MDKSSVSEAKRVDIVQIRAAPISPCLREWRWWSVWKTSVHISVDLLQQWVERRVRLGLFDDLHQLCVLRDQLPEVHHFLKEFWEEKGVIRMVALQVKFEHVHDTLLHFLNVSYV